SPVQVNTWCSKRLSLRRSPGRRPLRFIFLLTNRPILLSGFCAVISAGVHRLAAGAGMRADVSDALLRRLAGWSGPQLHLLHVVTAGRNVSCAAFLVPRWSFI